jgi:hypothetical protein
LPRKCRRAAPRTESDKPAQWKSYTSSYVQEPTLILSTYVRFLVQLISLRLNKLISLLTNHPCAGSEMKTKDVIMCCLVAFTAQLRGRW